MKKIIFLTVLTGALILVACNKDKENQGEAVFTATTEHLGGRTSLDPNNGQINWMAGDRIVIGNDNDETAIFSLRTGEGTTEGGFATSDEFNTVGPFIAAYPSDAVIENDKMIFNLPATQAIGETGTFANGANPMVACSDDKNLQFKNLCGGLGIRLKGVGAHVSAVRITSKNTSEKLWGAYEVSNCAANEPTLTEASNNQGSNVITLTCDVTLTTAAKTFIVMLPPGTLANGFTTEVLDGNEVLATKETTSDIALVERNNIKCFDEILIDVEFDGNIEIPTGMGPSDIIITNFGEDAIPDENGDFAIGYSKMLVAKNSDNGNIMYFGLYSIDPRNRSDKTGSDDYELNAKETALYLSLKLLPFYMQDGSDEVMNKMKESIYALPCVQSLESAIQNVVNTFGYLKTDEITNAVDAVGTFFYNEFSSLEQKGGISEPKSVKHENLESPYFNPGHRHGVRLNINESQFNAETQKWTINCTGYSSQFVALGLVPGYLDENTNEFSWNQQTANPYFLPPMSTSKYVELAENVGFLSSPGNWAGMLQLYRAMRESIQDPEYLLPYVTSHVDDMVFDIPRTINAIGVLSPKDAYVNGMLDLLNVVYIVVDGLSVVLPEYIPLDAVVNAYMSDGEFCQLFYNEHENGREGWALIFDSFKSKLPNVVLSLVPSTPQMVINHIVNELVPIDAITFFMDASIMAVTVNLLNSFELPVVADFPVSELPTVAITSVSAVSGQYAHVEARIVDEGAHSISAKGVCYSTSPEPDLNDNVVEGTYYGYGNNQFYCDLEDLEPNTTYYVRAYAQNWLQLVAYSEEEVSFTTQNVPNVTTLAVTNITNSSATANARVTFSNMSQIVERGFLYGTSDEGLWYGNIGSDAVVYEGTSQNDFSWSLTGLDPNTDYYVRAYAKTEERIGYGDIVPFTTLPSGGGGDGTHEYVDLGLPSGTLWATCNVGADVPEGYGDYFAWGETQLKDTYSWSTYQYCNGSDNTLTKYCNIASYGYNGFMDNLTTLLPEDDAATANWGNEWRMPTQAEWQELLDNTTVTWTQRNGVNGRLFTASNGNSLFLPAAGNRIDGSLYNDGTFGDIWSSSLETRYPGYACDFIFNSVNGYIDSGGRCFGKSVRAVRASSQVSSYTINVTSNPTVGGTVMGGGSYQQGQSCTVSATANMGYTFANWTENGIAVSTNANYTFTVSSNRTLVANFTSNGGGGNASDGALNGLFTINANGEQVYFSQGNLQYQASTNTWQFAEHQYDYVGAANSRISQTNSGWIDLFGWGTSGYNHGAVAYQPWSTSTNYNDYWAYGEYTYNLCDQNGQADWGYNAISNGGNTENGGWRTLTRSEWNYVFNTRSTTSGIRWAKANVNNVNGVILLPNNWTATTYALSNTNSSGANFTSNTITLADWANVLEANGAVFLPATGYRVGTSVYDVGSYGYYWSVSYFYSNNAYLLGFYDSTLDAGGYFMRYRGQSVRLVRSAR